jgi:ABC-type lipoprotein release transport system permease subunit
VFNQLVSSCLRLLGRSVDHSVHSISGYAWGIAVIIAISGIMSGFSTTIFGLTERTALSNQFSIKSTNPAKSLSNEIIEKLNLGEFDSILPITRSWVNFTSNEGFVQAELVGTNLTSLFSLYLEANVIEGTLPRINQTPVECLQGFELRGYLQSSVNYLLLNENISGNCDLVGTIAGVAELQQVIILHISDYLQIVGKNVTEIGFNEVKIKVRRSILLTDLKESLSKLLGNDYQDIIIWKESQAEVFARVMFKEILSKLELLYLVIFFLVIVRLYHNITWFTITYERTFLIMRALGLSRERLFFIMMILGLIMGNIGFGIGVLIGLIIPPTVLSLLTAFFSLNFIVVPLLINNIVQLWSISMVIITVATLIPSWKISRISPSKISQLIKEK